MIYDGFAPVAIIVGIIFYVAIAALFIWIAYLVIRAAVRSAMDDHYRKTQWYQETGLWYGGRPPKGLPGVSELSKSERKNLPRDERPEP